MSQQLVPGRRSRAPETWEPFTELEMMADRMRRMLDQTFGGMQFAQGEERRGWMPLVDIEETDDAYTVEADLPGVKREDLNIEVIGNELLVTGEIQEREHQGSVRRQTRRTGRFEYRVMLPDQVDADRIEARLNEGVLTLRVPKSERAQHRKIEIQSGTAEAA
jgi:HSP20 family protein